MDIVFRVNEENSESEDVKLPKCPHCDDLLIVERDSVLGESFIVGGPNVTGFKECVTAVYCSGCRTSFHNSILNQFDLAEDSEL